MAQVLEGQDEACEEFRAGLSLTRMSVQEFADLVGIDEKRVRDFYAGKTMPPAWALGYLRLMVFWSISYGAAAAVNNSDDGPDMRDELVRRVGEERADRQMGRQTRPAPASRER
jgi:hypothetical protein